MELEDVFRALADPNRRTLLDALRERDGQALGELEERLPGMTRFGVMKHLRLLEGAGLVTTRRDGRRKLHFLNPVPIQLIADRWISRYAQPWTAAMADLKNETSYGALKDFIERGSGDATYHRYRDSFIESLGEHPQRDQRIKEVTCAALVQAQPLDQRFGIERSIGQFGE